VLVVGITLVCIVSWPIYVSLQAESTLGAYYMTLEVLTAYAARNSGRWPQSWDDLRDVRHGNVIGGWSWPDDIDTIQDRVHIDFAISGDEVASSTPEHFTAVKLIGPNYGPDTGRVRTLIDTIRQARSGGTAK
jgi:hypothetical protein